MSAHASQAFSIAHCTDLEDLPTSNVHEDKNDVNDSNIRYSNVFGFVFAFVFFLYC